jgi:plasmid stability protein
MAQVLVRNLPDDVVDRLKTQAVRRRHSLEQELREILTRASRPSRAEMVAGIDRIRAMTPTTLQSDSTDILREERDREWR